MLYPQKYTPPLQLFLQFCWLHILEFFLVFQKIFAFAALLLFIKELCIAIEIKVSNMVLRDRYALQNIVFLFFMLIKILANSNLSFFLSLSESALDYKTLFN